MPSHIECRSTYYSESQTNSKLLNKSCNEEDEIKLFPSGSNLLNTLRATSAGVSGHTKRFSNENNTGKKN